MKNYFNKRNLIMGGVILASILLLSISVSHLRLDSSVQSLLPGDENLKRSVALTAHSSVSDKVILYIHTATKEQLDAAIAETDQIITKSGLLTDYLPEQEEIAHIRNYIQQNAAALYPYGALGNPFTPEEMQKRLAAKYQYLLSSPFEELGADFFSDPLTMSFDLLKLQFSSKRYLSMYKKGILSEDGLSFIRIFNAGFYSEDFKRSAELRKIDEAIHNSSVAANYKAFLYSSHLYFLESSSTIQREVSIIFVISILLTIAIFLYFFRNIELLFYSFMPIVAGVALTFCCIAVIYGKFGAIALAFGATTAGICIDYSIHYLSKISLYPTLKELRKKLGLSMLMGYLTTLLSFLILPFSKIGSLTEIAVFGALVVTFSYVVAWFLLQPLVKPESTSYTVRILNFGEGTRPLQILCIVAIIVTTLFALRIHLESNAFGLDMPHRDLDNRGEWIRKEFSESTDNVFIAFAGKTREEALKESTRAISALYTADPSLLFLNPALFIPTDEMIAERAQFIKEHFDQNKFKQLIAASEFTEDAFTPFTNLINEMEQGTFTLHDIPKFLKNEEKNSIVQYKDQYYLIAHIGDREKVRKITSICDQNQIHYITIDLLSDSAAGLLTFEKRALYLVFIAIALIFLILLAVYRTFKVAFASIMPPLAGLAGCLGISAITGTAVNIMHITACILILGIGVDYGIFVATTWYKKEELTEKNRTIQSIFSCALTTIAGFGVLSFSSSRALFSLGISMFAGIIFSFCTAYLLIPPLFKERRQ